MIKFQLHGVQIEAADDGSEATIKELVRDGVRKVPGKVLHTVKRTDQVSAESAAIQWAKAQRLKGAEGSEPKRPKGNKK